MACATASKFGGWQPKVSCNLLVGKKKKNTLDTTFRPIPQNRSYISGRAN